MSSKRRGFYQFLELNNASTFPKVLDTFLPTCKAVSLTFVPNCCIFWGVSFCPSCCIYSISYFSNIKNHFLNNISVYYNLRKKYVWYILNNKMSTYYRESFEYPPIRMFLESASANSINNNGNVTFTLNQQIQIPNDVVGYVSLQELTIANTNYNIYAYNNTLVLIDYAGNTFTYTITPGNYTVTTFLVALNAQLLTGTANFSNIVATYSDITNKFTLTCPFTSSLGISSLSTMNSCIGYPTGLNAAAYTTQIAGTSTTLVTTITRANVISITLNATDRLRFTDHTGTNRDVQIPANPLYAPSALATAITTLTSPFNIICTYNNTTQLFTFVDRTSSTTLTS